MHLAHNWATLERTLLDRAETLYARDTRSTLQMVGVVFAPAHLEETRRILWPAFDYWHHRSGELIDFYWPGYSLGYHLPGNGIPSRLSALLRTSFFPERRNQPVWLGDVRAGFSNDEFVSFIDELDRRLEVAGASASVRNYPELPHILRGRYSGGLDLLLMNVCYDPAVGRISLDYSSGIFVHLLRLGELGLGYSIAEFVETVFEYVKYQDGSDPTWGFRNNLDIDLDNDNASLLGLVTRCLMRAARAAGMAVDLSTLYTVIQQ